MLPSAIEALHETCCSTLASYLADPWRWPRESDLIVDLVADLRRTLGSERVPANLRLPRSLSASDVPRTAPRVRTEVRLRPNAALTPEEEKQSGTVDSAEEAGEPRQHHRQRVDIAILRSSGAELVLHRNGARDVVLEVDPDHVEGLLEVKLYPGSYLKGGECEWFTDIVKLDLLGRGIPRGVLLVDTSLPLASAAVTYANRRSTLERPERPSVPRWPLGDGAFTVVSDGQTFAFQPVDRAQGTGVHLWALAIDGTASWRAEPDNATRDVPLLPIEDVRVRCWAVNRR